MRASDRMASSPRTLHGGRMNAVTDGEYNRIIDRLNKLYFSGDKKKE